ncbi:TonB-dependent receptor [Spirosoma endbachense]|uniref:TonB-dependent receptor plug domain-containing protein n=1 Tax=Spirosoma endbachense TaxID=2666025 RepID=A0A6P1W0Y9_9BACT|nr:TonB-dependent receptor [Spirosoma endbachense]QHV97346.1 TonB-dependent receptor plug domain-containing protein [Spirosoma endbachense]
MKIIYVISALQLTTSVASAQVILAGRVTDQKGQSLPGANVFLRGTYDGANTDSTGSFRFSTTRKDTATLQVSYIGYESFSKKVTLGSPNPIAIRLTEAANELNTVVITAGSFEASDERRMTMLKPMDIVTTAGANADITAAMNLLPGTQRVGEQTGLFVRGGSGEEAKVVIDGMIVQNPYFSSMPDVQSRGRFQPFMFKGTSFSTGGYSAQYGQALSSVLLLNTTDKTQNEGVSLSLNLANAGISYDHATEKSSVSATGYYGNLKPLFSLVRQNIDWTHVPEFAGSSLTYRLQPTKTGMFKFYGMYSDSRLGMNFVDPSNETGKTALQQHNRNFFTTSTYTDSWANGRWLLNSGLSYSYDTDATTFDTQDFGRSSARAQGRFVLTRLFGNNSLLFGTEAHAITIKNSVQGIQYALHDNYGAVFIESQTYLGRNLAVQAGIRGEYSSVLSRFNLAPRLSLAYKTGMFSQVSMAYGQFYQTPDYRYLYRNTSLDFERADHLILNYQIIKNKRTFRIETFYKNYAQLVREFTGQPFDANPYRFPIGTTNNTGNGYAQGFDVFWRDQKTIKGLDYWVTYSYVDSRRLFQQYTVQATPTFISNHNISLIMKRYFEKISTNMGLTYTVSSGRPYFNPNNEVFLADRTPIVNNLSFSASHIMSIKKNFVVLYASIDNILNTHNVFTYRYTPDAKTRYAVGPQSYRSFFVGGMIMLSKKAKVNVNEL